MATPTPMKKVEVIPNQKVTITPPNFKVAAVTIRGTAPYMQNSFSSANRDAMIRKQKEGSSSAKTRKAKAPKDFEAIYQSSMHISQEGWHGIPSGALRQAMIDACRTTEIDMTRAKMCIFIIEDGLDRESLEPLTKIDGKPQMHTARVKIGINQTDIAARAIFVKWSAKVTIRWDDDFFKAQDVINLLARAGIQVGIGAGRPLSKSSAGTGKGTWEIEGGFQSVA